MAELTGKAVSELPEATNAQDFDLLAISQNATSKKVTVGTLKNTFLPNKINEHVLANVAEIESLFESIVADKNSEYREVLTVTHIDNNVIVPQPYVRWSGMLVKNWAGNTITFTASSYIGQIIVMSRDPNGTWRVFQINGTQA